MAERHRQYVMMPCNPEGAEKKAACYKGHLKNFRQLQRMITFAFGQVDS